MELFWVIFWLMLLALPALWIVNVLWGIVFYLITMVIGGVIWVIQAIVDKAKGE